MHSVFAGLDPVRCREYATTLETELREVIKVGVEIRRIDFEGHFGMASGPCNRILQCDSDISAAVALLRRKADDVEMLDGNLTRIAAVLKDGRNDPARKRSSEQLVEDAAALLVSDNDGPQRMIPIIDELVRRGVPLAQARTQVWGRAAAAIAIATDFQLNASSGDIGDQLSPIATASKSYKAADAKLRELANKVDLNVELVATISIHYVGSVIKTYENKTIGQIQESGAPEWYGQHIKMPVRRPDGYLEQKAVWNNPFIETMLVVITAKSGDQQAVKEYRELRSGAVHAILGFTGPFGAGFMLGESVNGKDAISGRKLSTGERVLNAVPAVAYGVAFGVKAAQLSKLQTTAKTASTLETAELAAANATKTADLTITQPTATIPANGPISTSGGPTPVKVPLPPGGASRAMEYGGNWQQASLSEKVAEFAGSNPVVTTNAQKTIYTNPSTGIEVVYDRAGNYFRIADKSGDYLMLDGSAVPANVPIMKPNGKYAMSGVSKDVRLGLTHFKALP